LSEIDESWLLPEPAAETPLKKFAPEEMLTCDACLRANAPTRAQCMYCGAPLSQSTTTTQTVEPAAPEEAEGNKHYVVVSAPDGRSIDDSAVAQLATRFHWKPEELHVALGTSGPVPLTSVSSESDAMRISSELKNVGIESAAVSTVQLKIEVNHTIIRALEFGDGSVTAVTKVGKQRLPAELNDIQLVVTGRLLVHRVEIDERRSRSSVKALDRREISEDQTVVDLHLRSFDAPWRILVNDFDFSCLGEHKGLTVFDNINALVEMLKERTPAEVNDSYTRVRTFLNNVWPLQNTASQSRSRRPRAGRHDFSTVTASDNESQFNNYSRLVWCWQRRDQKPLDESGSV
jgi:hypothetical protein